MTIPSYATGTASIASGGTTVTITGGVLTGNARELDFIVINGVLAGPILAITDATHLTVPKWGGAAQTSVAYAIYQVAQRSSADTSFSDDLRKQVAALNFQGFPVIVPPTSTVPDPSLGDEGQFAVQFLPALAWWQKTGGLWVASGGPIMGYGGTSTTSLPLSVASKSFTTQANLAYLVGSRVRLSNDSTHYMEGPVTAYNAGTGAMTVNVTRIVGTGTFAAWNLSITGDSSSGDLLASNNLSDLASPATARTNLGLGNIAIKNLSDLFAFSNTTEATGAGTTASGIFSGGLEVLKKLFVSGVAAFTSSTASTSTTTGAVTVTGGLGAGGAGNFGGAVTAPSFLSNISGGLAWTFDGSQNPLINIASGGNSALPPGAGLILIYNGNTGGVAIYHMGSGTGTLLSSFGNSNEFVAPTTTPGAGKSSMASNGTNYAIYNNTGGACNYRVVSIKLMTGL